MTQPIDTADHVRHIPSGEEWVVACVIGDRLSWCGWPEGSANMKDCELVEKATPEQRDALLLELAVVKGDDHRQRYAAERLKPNGETA